jgi:hypothetical protein
MSLGPLGTAGGVNFVLHTDGYLWGGHPGHSQHPNLKNISDGVCVDKVECKRVSYSLVTSLTKFLVPPVVPKAPPPLLMLRRSADID